MYLSHERSILAREPSGGCFLFRLRVLRPNLSTTVSSIPDSIPAILLCLHQALLSILLVYTANLLLDIDILHLRQSCRIFVL